MWRYRISECATVQGWSSLIRPVQGSSDKTLLSEPTRKFSYNETGIGERTLAKQNPFRALPVLLDSTKSLLRAERLSMPN